MEDMFFHNDDQDPSYYDMFSLNSPDKRRSSPMLRPKARAVHAQMAAQNWSPQPGTAVDPGGQEVNHFPLPPHARGRRSPMVFEPIMRNTSIDPADDADAMLSMAGQITAQDLRRSRGVEGVTVTDPEDMIKATVMVFVTQVTPSYSMPWSRGEEARSTGSGFAVEMPGLDEGLELAKEAAGAGAGDFCILTNAHVVENFSLVQVRRAGAADKFVARVLCIGHDVDLAILQVANPAFWDGLPFVRLGEGGLPKLASEVVAVGFPVGGDDVSATRGVVSRILVGGLTDNLCVQIDAAINPGNSGGPVFDIFGNVVGVAFSGLLNSNGIGYIIPLPVLHTFLSHFRRHGEYTGKCSDCFEIQSMENEALRKRFGLHGASGVMLSRIPPESACHGVLEVRDILLKVDGVVISNDGTIQLPGTQDLVRVTFSYLVYRSPRDHPLKLLILRKGQQVELTVPAQPQPDLLLNCKTPLPRPTYLCVGGLVFVPLMSPYEALIPRLKIDSVLRKPAYEGQQAVMLMMVLRAEVNVGYEDLTGRLESLNDVPTQSLRQLKQQVEEVTSGNMRFRLESGEMIVMSAAKVWESEEAIFGVHCIPQRATLE